MRSGSQTNSSVIVLVQEMYDFDPEFFFLLERDEQGTDECLSVFKGGSILDVLWRGDL